MKTSGVDRIAIVFFFWCIIIVLIAPLSVRGEFIENPVPTHDETRSAVGELVLVKQIGPDIDEKHILARPSALTVNEQSELFVYDGMQRKVFKFNRNFKLVREFGGTGQGPGEFHPWGLGFYKINFEDNGRLYAADVHNGKLIEFDRDGNYVKDIRLDPENLKSFFPVRDEHGNFYTLAGENGAVDMFAPDMMKLHTFLSGEHYNRFVVYKPKPVPFKSKKVADVFTLPDLLNTYYDALSGNRFIIYISHSSTVYLFKNKKLVRQFDILPRSTMENYRKSVEDKRKLMKKRMAQVKSKPKIQTLGYWPMFASFFIDRDSEKYFYLLDYDSLYRMRLFKFDLSGKLVRVLYAPQGIKGNIFAVRNNLFYGLFPGEGKIFILKEKRKVKGS